MKYFLGFIAVIAIIAIVLAMSIWGARGTLIKKTQAVDGSWAQVQNVYQRRFDLVPNLVAAVDDFMGRQQKTLEGVIQMRQRVIEIRDEASAALGKQNPAKLDSLAGMLSKQLNSFISMVKEAYPEIKGDNLYSDLMTQIEGTENRITQERRGFNDSVQDYNTYRQTGISALIAGSFFGYPYSKEFFKADEAAQKAPSVKDAFNNK